MPHSTNTELIDYLAGDKLPVDRANILPHEKNCVAYSLSKCLGTSLYDTIGFLIAQGWITKGSDLENDAAYMRCLEGMGMTLVLDSIQWSQAKTRISGLRDGRYFAVNTKTNPRGGDGHAFAIIKSGGWGVSGNNQEVKPSVNAKAKPYHAQIQPGHHISVWGPVNG